MRPAGKCERHTVWPDFLSNSLERLRNEGRYRRLQVMESAVSTRMMIDGRSFLLFCSNDYLGLASDRRLVDASVRATRSWGTGAGASRLISGNSSLYRDLEAAIACFKQTEAALVFASGYATNVGVITSLVDRADLIFSDALNHASIVDACRLSKARIRVYPHGDADRLKEYLAADSGAGKVLVVTDGVFSMAGDLAPLPEIGRVCREYGALLMVDDAHGTGVMGPRGGGTLDYFNMAGGGIVQVGTFSKALGGLGGFVSGSGRLIDFLINRARSLIYSTALPPAVLASNREAVRIAQEDGSGRKRLQALIRRMRGGLQRLGFQLPPQPTPILPLRIGDIQETLHIAAYLRERGIFVPPIRPPTVPPGESCLRISLSALHTTADLGCLLQALADFYRKGS